MKLSLPNSWMCWIHFHQYDVSLKAALLAPDISQLPIDSKVLLRSGNSVEEFIRKDGTFTLHNIKPGNYVLIVKCRTIAFQTLSVEVPASKDDVYGELPVVKPYIFGQAPFPPPDAGAPSRPEPWLQYPIQLVPIAQLKYEDIKVGFNPISMILGNPMYLLMGGMAIFVMVMPKLIALMDPEALAEMQANQASLHQQMNSIKNIDLTSGFAKVLSASNENDSTGDSSLPTQASVKSNPKSIDSTSAKRRK